MSKKDHDRYLNYGRTSMVKKIDAVKLQREIREELGQEYWSDRKAFFEKLKEHRRRSR